MAVFSKYRQFFRNPVGRKGLKLSKSISLQSGMLELSDLGMTNFSFGMLSFINLNISSIIGIVALPLFLWFRIFIPVR